MAKRKGKRVNLTKILGIGGPGANPQEAASAVAASGVSQDDLRLLLSEKRAGRASARAARSAAAGNLKGAPAFAGSVNKASFLERLKSDPKKLLKDFSKTGEAKWLGASVLMEIIGKQFTDIQQTRNEADLQGQNLELQGEMGPQIQEQQALQPVTEARKQQALQMLMRQMGQNVPNVAEGEVWT